LLLYELRDETSPLQAEGWIKYDVSLTGGLTGSGSSGSRLQQCTAAAAAAILAK
jgi:hypothetical protein